MSEEEIADAAAELDEDPQTDTGAADEADGDAPAGPTYAGRCHGGPWDTSDVESRFPKGFLLVHMPARAVWVYDRRPDGDFYVRDSAPAELNEDGPVSRWRAAEEANYDIRVLDPDAVEPAVSS